MSDAAYLELTQLTKSYPSPKGEAVIVKDLNFKFRKGEFVAIVGFSGAGKTTLMNLLSGLAFPDKGNVTFDGKPVTGPGPERGLVFQNYSLLPWLTVYEIGRAHV